MVHADNDIAGWLVEWPGRAGDSVHRALNTASAALARATDPAEGAGG